ncbi:hypothetical protein ACPGAX_004538 [Enterobacter quasiroggenkampii]
MNTNVNPLDNSQNTAGKYEYNLFRTARHLNSQCNSPLIAGLQDSGHFSDLSSRLVCHFPLE